MPVQFSKAALIKKNQSAIDACSELIERLKKLGEEPLPPAKEHDRLIQLGRATDERTRLRIINAHLKAAGTTVKPLDDDLAEELNDLGNKLDAQIQNDLIIDATIDFAISVLDDVQKLRGIVNKA